MGRQMNKSIDMQMNKWIREKWQNTKRTTENGTKRKRKKTGN